MEVSQRIVVYVQQEVKKRLEPKYEKDKERSLVIKKHYEGFKEMMNTLAREAAMQMSEAINSVECLTVDINRLNNIEVRGFGSFVRIEKDDSFNWPERLAKETEKISRDILVALELGGTMEDLNRLLNEIH